MSRQLRLQFHHQVKRKNRPQPNCDFEQQYYNQGYQRIAGIDEAGRGPLAGPVVAAAVILPAECLLPGINDSKKLTAKQRDKLYQLIVEQAVSVGVGIVSEKVIDEINILQASIQAMLMAIEKLSVQPECLLIDAVTLPDCPLPQQGIIKGDQKSVSIAAASIVAKVVRDTIMHDYERQYPNYHFAKHKGYATKQHIAEIKQFGLCEIHRRSFCTAYLSCGIQ
ncbi:MAG: ribonuclease HII [bacterium]|nr:ribonuclease HII [bacterium]